jgi:PhzF family phenazine biosynthesis protein
VRSYSFKQVDVFTQRPFLGNPVAVVLGADDIDPVEMQRIAAWTNLSETTFVLRPTSSAASYRLRIFAPDSELPFAGHPTIGSAHAVMEAGIVSESAQGLAQECAAGVLPLRVEGSGNDRRIFVRVPEAKVVAEHGRGRAAISAAVGGQVMGEPAPLAIDIGPVWLVARVDGRESLSGLRPDMVAVEELSRRLDVVGLTIFTLADGDGPAVHLRTFAPAAGVPEDPVCGSCNAALAAYLTETGLLAETGESYVAAQGRERGRDGSVLVRVMEGGGRIEIGGCAVTVIDGEVAV